jgi:hypothetical protein
MLKLNNISRLDVMEDISSKLADTPTEETKKVEGEKKQNHFHLSHLLLIYVIKLGLVRLTHCLDEKRKF